MIIETTINLEKTKRELIKAAAEIMGVTRSRMIVLLVHKLLSDHEKLMGRNGAMRYQGKKPAYKWSRVHVSLLFRDYEYLLDLKKVCKCSGSFLIAFAIDNYLDDFINRKLDNTKNHKSTDNYPFYHKNLFDSYIIQKEMVGKAVCWKLYWGYPPTTAHLFPEN